ncbi:MAG: hypothetical protein Q3966_06430 [Neisseria sp.]|nr:hypothetical protein [Neisseria sp.]
MFKDILLPAVQEDFLRLAALTKGREIYGCALVTGSGFGNVAVKIAAHTKRGKAPDPFFYVSTHKAAHKAQPRVPPRLGRGCAPPE